MIWIIWQINSGIAGIFDNLFIGCLYTCPYRGNVYIRGKSQRNSQIILCGSLIISLGVFFSMYLVCTKPDSSWIGGVQGRYFVTPALICGMAFAGLLHFPRFPRRVYPVCLYLFLSAGFATLVYEGIRLYWSGVLAYCRDPLVPGVQRCYWSIHRLI